MKKIKMKIDAVREEFGSATDTSPIIKRYNKGVIYVVKDKVATELADKAEVLQEKVR